MVLSLGQIDFGDSPLCEISMISKIILRLQVIVAIKGDLIMNAGRLSMGIKSNLPCAMLDIVNRVVNYLLSGSTCRCNEACLQPELISFWPDVYSGLLQAPLIYPAM